MKGGEGAGGVLPLRVGTEGAMGCFSCGVHWVRWIGPDGEGMNAPFINVASSRTPTPPTLLERLSSPSAIPVGLRISMGAVSTAALVLFLSALLGMGGCETDRVGHTKTVEKTVIDTPTERVTTTEVKEKDTRIVK